MSSSSKPSKSSTKQSSKSHGKKEKVSAAPAPVPVAEPVPVPAPVEVAPPVADASNSVVAPTLTQEFDALLGEVHAERGRHNQEMSKLESRLK